LSFGTSRFESGGGHNMKEKHFSIWNSPPNAQYEPLKKLAPGKDSAKRIAELRKNPPPDIVERAKAYQTKVRPETYLRILK